MRADITCIGGVSNQWPGGRALLHPHVHLQRLITDAPQETMGADYGSEHSSLLTASICRSTITSCLLICSEILWVRSLSFPCLITDGETPRLASLFTMPWAGPPSSAQVTCLICIPGLHDPWRYTDRRGLTPIFMGKSRVAQLQSAALGIQAQGRSVSLDNNFYHYGSFPLSCPWLHLLKPSFPLCPAGQWGFLALNSELLQPGSIFVAGGNGPRVYLLTLVSWASLSAGKLISGCYLSH